MTDIFELQRSVRLFFNKNLVNRACAVTLTLRQTVAGEGGVGRVKLTADQAQQNYRHFLNLLNRAVFGKRAARFGRSVVSIPVLEGGRGHRLHYHAVIGCPSELSYSDFEELIRDCWAKTQWGYDEVDIQPDADAGWINYISKLRDKPDYAEAIDWQNYHA